MNPTPDQVPDRGQRLSRQETARATALDAAARRRERRRRDGSDAIAVDRRWRFTDAVSAARQLSSGGAPAG